MKNVLTLFISLSCFVSNAQTQQKIALVIGIRDYEFVQPLKNTLNDARDMSNALEKKGFDVISVYNPKTKRELQQSIGQFYSKLTKSSNTVGLVFYSGHGMQVDGINYLMPTSANPQLKADLDDQAVKMEYLLSAVEQAGNSLNIFIMDACRNNPFRSFSRSADPGLVQVNAPKGSYVVYATSPGSVASDGTGSNGLFTSKLLKYISQPNINIEQVFKYVARDVQQESNGSQVPWINYSYFGDFYFALDGQAVGNHSVQIEQKRPQIENDLTFSSELKPVVPNNFFLEKYRLQKQARVEFPASSPSTIISSDLGFMEVGLDFSRPLQKGRKIFGDGPNVLAPYGKIWRTGANSGTKIYFSKDVNVAQSLVPKGVYSIYTWPGKNSWFVSLYKDLTLAGNTDMYDEKQEVVKFSVVSELLDDAVNTFTGRIEKSSVNSGKIVIEWESTSIAIPFSPTVFQKTSDGLYQTTFQKIGISGVTIENHQDLANAPVSNDFIQLGRISFEDKSILADKVIDAGSYAIRLKNGKLYLGNQQLGCDPIPGSNSREKIQIVVKELMVDMKSSSMQVSAKGHVFIFPLIVDYDSRVNRMIDRAIEDSPTSTELFHASIYYLENNLDLRKALEWINRALIDHNDYYWMLYQKAKIQKALGDWKGAKESANSSIKEAKRAKNQDYVKLNEDLLQTLN